MAPIVANHLYKLKNEFLMIFQIISELPFFVACRPSDVQFSTVKETLPDLFLANQNLPITLLPCKKETEYGYKCRNRKTGDIGMLYRKLN